MRHVRIVSTGRPASASDDLVTITAVISLLTSIMGLLGQISTVFGISFNLCQKEAAET